MKWYKAEVAIRDLSHDGWGIGTLENGKIAFINGALPGERVEAMIQSRKKGQLFGRLESVLEAAQARVEPICPHYHLCGGCAMQHISDEEQIRFKEQRLIDNLSRIAKIDGITLEPTLIGDTKHYRRKARLGIKYVEKKGGVIIGFREKGSSLITPIEDCKTLAQPVPSHLSLIKEMVAKLSIRNRVPQVELAVGENIVHYIFRTLDEPNESDLTALREFAINSESAVFIQPKGPDSITPVWPLEPEDLTYRIISEDICFKFKAYDFVQVNASVNRAMIAQAIDWLAPQQDEVVADLFCGLGNFTLPLARHSNKVYGLEADAGLMERANINARLNRLESRVEFITQNLYDDPDLMIPTLKESDIVVLDPPRSGALEASVRIVANGISRVLYVSCNPATLARDVAYFCREGGYRLEKIAAMNMFAHTAHIESMSLLVKD